MASINSLASTNSSKNGIVADFSSMEEGKYGPVQTPMKELSSRGATFISASQKIIAEFVGTYIFIFVGCGSALVDRERKLTIVGMALAWGLSLMALIYTLGHVSGAHFNPAVTIAFSATRKLPLLHVPMYVLPQFLGSTLACLTLKVLFNHQDDILPTLTRYKSPVTDFEAIFWEFIMTLILMFVICGAATDDRANKEVAGVAIGVTLAFEVLIAGPITGASMNPARSLGPAIVSGVYKNQWVFVIAPILGAMTATGIYSLLRQPKQSTRV
ncbi:nodulin-26-like [Lycium ferocissimum]|uniref:nodulin-26-like n=1 Tax=Lycium ferocissimum TaxID=112874 RepID=UPI002815B0C2|nr:nodulin-26-like [Lycium ferocissimum]